MPLLSLNAGRLVLIAGLVVFTAGCSSDSSAAFHASDKCSQAEAGVKSSQTYTTELLKAVAGAYLVTLGHVPAPTPMTQKLQSQVGAALAEVCRGNSRSSVLSAVDAYLGQTDFQMPGLPPMPKLGGAN